MFVGSSKEVFASRLKELVWQLEREQYAEDEVAIPATIFSTNLSPLQSLVTYLKDIHDFSFQDIARSLDRSYATIYAAYKKQRRSPAPTKYLVPLSFFGTGLCALEACVVYLKEEAHLNFSEIARLVKKDPRTIWSTYDRAKKKK